MNTKLLTTIKSFFLGTIIIWIATYLAVLGDSRTDYAFHINWASQVNFHELGAYMTNKISYPLWHIIVKLVSKVLEFDIEIAAASVTAFLNCFAFWCTIKVWKYLAERPIEYLDISFWSVCLFFVGPLSAPWFTSEYYLGQGTGNVWHNPTNIAVRSFSILCFFIIVIILDSSSKYKNSARIYILLAILLFFSALAKPSFLQGIIPGLGFYFVISLIIRCTKQNFIRYCKIALCFIPAALLILAQFILSFFIHSDVHAGNGIGIEFGRVLHRWSPNLLISFLLAFAFPIYVFASNFKKLIHKTHFQLGLCYELCAWCEGAFLYEKGIREGHGNWLWGSYLSMFIIWMLSFIYYFDSLQIENETIVKKWNIFIGFSLLFFHLIFGINFWYYSSLYCL